MTSGAAPPLQLITTPKATPTSAPAETRAISDHRLDQEADDDRGREERRGGGQAGGGHQGVARQAVARGAAARALGAVADEHAGAEQDEGDDPAPGAGERLGQPAVAVEVRAAGGESEERPTEQDADREPPAPV